MMEPSRDFIGYVVTGVVAAFILKRLLTTLSAKRKIPALLKEGAQIVDVRSPGEFATGHAAGSRNIPLGDLERGAKDLDSKRWVIVCCASGTRSGTARRWLSTRRSARASSTTTSAARRRSRERRPCKTGADDDQIMHFASAQMPALAVQKRAAAAGERNVAARWQAQPCAGMPRSAVNQQIALYNEELATARQLLAAA